MRLDASSRLYVNCPKKVMADGGHVQWFFVRLMQVVNDNVANTNLVVECSLVCCYVSWVQVRSYVDSQAKSEKGIESNVWVVRVLEHQF